MPAIRRVTRSQTRAQRERAENLDPEIHTIQVPVDLTDLGSVLVPETTESISQVDVPEDGYSSLPPDATAFTMYGTTPLPGVTPAVLRSVNPCQRRKTPAVVRRKPYDRLPKGDPHHRSHAQKRNSVRNANRLGKKKASNEAAGPSNYKVSTQASIKFSKPMAIPLVNIDAGDLKASKGAYQSRSIKTVTDTTILTVEECLRRRYLEFEWNGRDTVVLVDQQNRILAVLVGRPDDSEWENTLKEATKAMREAMEKLTFPCDKCHMLSHDERCKDCKKGRGDYQAISVGLSLGNGSVVPGMLKQDQRNIQILRDLVTNKHVRRLAGFANSCLAFYFPKLYRELVEQLDKLYERDPTLQRLFPSIFPGATFNFGPQTVTLPHYDSKNKGNGIVSLCSLGEFDHRKGGHVVFLTLKMFVQFPSGSTILFPSAIIEHANTPIGSEETRMSFTQWMAGGLFRWVDYGFQLMDDCKNRNPALYKQLEKGKRTAWDQAIQRYSIYSELQKDHESCFPHKCQDHTG